MDSIRAAIYTRVSSIGQVDGFGLKVQEEKCKQMIDFKDWTLHEVYSDAGISGTYGPDRRPGLKDLIEAAKNKDFDAIVVHALDRLGRKTILVLELIELFKEIGIKVVSCKEQLDTTTPMGAFYVTMNSAIVQLERDNIVARMKEGSKQRVKLDGDNGGSLPYGYRRSEGELIIDSEAADVVRKIFDMKDLRITQVQIADNLNSEGILSPKGKRWTQSVISKILSKRDIYNGAIRNGNVNGVTWPRIIWT